MHNLCKRYAASFRAILAGGHAERALCGAPGRPRLPTSMRRVLRTVGWIVAGTLTLVLLALIYVLLAYPRSEAAPALSVQPTPERVAQGRYLFHHIAQCADCHAVRDRTRVGDPVVPGGLGKENFGRRSEAPFFPPNLTPAALGDWTDGEIARAISSGIRRDGAALFPAMPYGVYRHMAMPDLEALVAYMRTLEPVPVEHPREPLPFPMSLIARLSARPAAPPAVTPGSGVERGRYLADIAGCRFCHTPVEGTPPRAVEGLELAGGHEFTIEGWTVRSANLTPDNETGIGLWSREDFLDRFRAARVEPGSSDLKPAGTPPTVMPWAGLAGMREQDLGAIYDYLRTVGPVRQEVMIFERSPTEGAEASGID